MTRNDNLTFRSIHIQVQMAEGKDHGVQKGGEEVTFRNPVLPRSVQV